ncbi:MAG: hypothetical protein IPH74_13890 [Bacteroidetes bacterium]|nr:hypothetical protein [Bacteroidota bacterium]
MFKTSLPETINIFWDSIFYFSVSFANAASINAFSVPFAVSRNFTFPKKANRLISYIRAILFYFYELLTNLGFAHTCCEDMTMENNWQFVVSIMYGMTVSFIIAFISYGTPGMEASILLFW